MSRLSLNGSSTCRSRACRLRFAAVLALAWGAALAGTVAALDNGPVVLPLHPRSMGRRIGLSWWVRLRHHTDSRRVSVDRRRKGPDSVRRIDLPFVRSRKRRKCGPRGPCGARCGRRLRTEACGRGSGSRAVSLPRRRISQRSADIGPPESVVSALLRGRDGAILLATLGRGAVAYRGGQFTSIAAPKALPSSSFVISIAESSNGDVWLGSRDAGLLRVQGGRVSRLTDGLPDLKINCLLAGNGGEVWIGTDRGVARWDGTAITREGIPEALRQTTALNMIRDRESNTWIAAGPRGLLRVTARRCRAFGARQRRVSPGMSQPCSKIAKETCGSAPIRAWSGGAIPSLSPTRSRKACRATRSDLSMPDEVRTGLVRPVNWRIVLNPRRRHRGSEPRGACQRCRVLDPWRRR